MFRLFFLLCFKDIFKNKMILIMVQNTAVKLKCDILADFAHNLIQTDIEKMFSNFEENQAMFYKSCCMQILQMILVYVKYNDIDQQKFYILLIIFKYNNKIKYRRCLWSINYHHRKWS